MASSTVVWFEASQRKGDDTLKAFLRDGLKNSSVTCVLAGAMTWSRRWVRYEIVQSILKGNDGLLTVDIDGMKDKDQKPAIKGADPLAQVGLYRTEAGIHFAEWNGYKWIQYKDYMRTVSESSLWFAAPNSAKVQQLSHHCRRHSFASDNGRKEIAPWIEQAAATAGWQ